MILPVDNALSAFLVILTCLPVPFMAWISSFTIIPIVLCVLMSISRGDD